MLVLCMYWCTQSVFRTAPQTLARVAEDRPLISNASAVILAGKAREEGREASSCTFGFSLPLDLLFRHSGLQRGNWFARWVVPFRMMQGTYKQPSNMSILFLFPPCIIFYHDPLCSANDCIRWYSCMYSVLWDLRAVHQP